MCVSLAFATNPNLFHMGRVRAPKRRASSFGLHCLHGLLGLGLLGVGLLGRIVLVAKDLETRFQVKDLVLPKLWGHGLGRLAKDCRITLRCELLRVRPRSPRAPRQASGAETVPIDVPLTRPTRQRRPMGSKDAPFCELSHGRSPAILSTALQEVDPQEALVTRLVDRLLGLHGLHCLDGLPGNFTKLSLRRRHPFTRETRIPESSGYVHPTLWH